MDLVIGGTGHLGRRVVATLRARGHEVGVLTRDDVDTATIEAMGAELIPGDLRDPASVDAACVEVEAVVVTANAVVPRDRTTEDELTDSLGYLFEACHRERLRHLVLVSPLRGPFDADAPHLAGRREAERLLARSPVPHTITRLAPLTEFWLALAGLESVAAGEPTLQRAQGLLGEASRDWSTSTERSGVLRAFGDVSAQLPLLSVVDAAGIVAAIASGEPRGEVEIVGPEPRGWRSLLAASAEHLGRRLRLAPITGADLRSSAGFLRRRFPGQRPGTDLLGFVRAVAASRAHAALPADLPPPTRGVEDVLASAGEGITRGRDGRG